MNEPAIIHLKAACPRLSRLIDEIGALEIHEQTDSFLFLTREIVGQMVSAAVKKIMFERLTTLCDGRITANNVLEHDVTELRGIGLSKAKSMSIMTLAQKVKDGEIDFDKMKDMPDDEVLKELTSLKGIGNWTAKMYLLFFLQRDDVLPYEDGAFLQAYRWLYHTKRCKQKSIERRCRKWKPYTSIGARYLYFALDSGLTKRDVNEWLNETDKE